MKTQQLISNLKDQIFSKDWIEPEIENDQYGMVISFVLPKSYIKICELDKKFYVMVYTVTIDDRGCFECLYGTSNKIEDFKNMFYTMLNLNK